ncbi:MAG: hypothetical protein DRI39_08580 [Chloroflexi bacterium]|nr:MAG: hypothetical protein DRI39_08580 [Chloroflexota bacterium]
MEERGKLKDESTEGAVQTSQQTAKAETQAAERRQAEELLRAWFVSSPIGMYIVQDGAFRIVNPTFERLLGYSESELVGMDPMMLVSPDDRSMVRENAVKMLKGMRTSPYEFRYVTRSGESKWVMETVSSIQYEGRQAALGYFMDITGLKETEWALRESERRYRLLAENITDVIFCTDMDLRPIYVSPSIERLLGYTVEESMSRTPIEAMTPESLQVAVDALAAEVAKGYRDRDRFRPRVRELEFRRKDGSTVWAEVRVSLIRDEAGQATEVLGVMSDVTKRKKMEQELRKSEASLARAQRVARLGNWDWDIVNDELRFSEEIYRIFGLSTRDRVSGHDTFLESVHPEDREFVRKAFDQALYERKTYSPDYRIVLPDGSERVVHEQVEITYDENGMATRVVGTVQDITEIRDLAKKVIEYEEMNKFKSNLLSTVSHELRTPLATIKGYCTLLLDYDKRLRGGEKREYLESIDKATERLAELVNHLLDMSRLEAGLLKLDRAPTSVAKLVQEAVAEAKMRDQGHEIVLDLQGRLPRLNLDARRIRQVLDNLLDNAVKYSEPGTRVMVEARQVGLELVVSIRDSGMGIPRDSLDRVFDLMYRVEQRLASDTRGAGLGLAICKGLVEAHGGRIWVESEPGKGSTFHFALPLERRKGHREHGQEAPGKKSPRSRG